MAVACVYTMLPVVRQMTIAWSDECSETNLYSARGLPLMGDNGRLRVERIFSWREAQRPARQAHPVYSWEGYLDGTYLDTDKVGTLSVSQQRLLAVPGLRDIVMASGTVMQVACTADICEGAGPVSIPLSAQAAARQSVECSRNFIVYAVTVPKRSLVTENETFMPGWSAICEIHGEHLEARRVDGGFRGWVLDAGEHRLRVSYHTPWLVSSAVASIVFFACWVVATVMWFRSPTQAIS